MDAHPDFQDLLVLLNEHSVEYVIVGGYALAFHGTPRFTGDIDIFVHPHPDNAPRILDSLREFGFKFSNLNVDDFVQPNKVVQIGFPPLRIDLITSISGVSWDQAAAHKVAGTFGSVPVFYIGQDEIIANKRASGRPKDMVDVAVLEKHLLKKRKSAKRT